MTERTHIPRASRPFESPMTLAIRNRAVTVASDTSLRPAGADVAEADPAQRIAADPSIIDAERHPLYRDGVQRHSLSEGSQVGPVEASAIRQPRPSESEHVRQSRLSVAGATMIATAEWFPVKVSDWRLLGLRDRHYTCKSPGAATAGPPGQRIAFVTFEGTAAWISHRPRPEYVDHDFGTGDVCTLFRNEGAGLSSEMIESAIGMTEAEWGANSEGWLTFVDVEKVRTKRDPGRCFRKAGFVPVGYTKARHFLALARLGSVV